MKLFKKIIFSILILVFVIICFLYFIISDAKKQGDILMANPITFSHKVPNDYGQLFNTTQKLKLYITTNSPYRNPISEFYFDRNYYIEVYKIAIINDISLNKLVEEEFSDTEFRHGTYEGNASYNETPFFIGYKFGYPDAFEKVYFSLTGINSHIIKKNDSTAYYSSNFSKFSIKYKENGGPDFYGEMKPWNEDGHLPLELLFLRKNKALYIIILSVMNKGIRIDNNMLCKIVNY